MHFVAALDAVPDMRAVLTLFEGVATGAADGYARMAEKPAATLLHLGPGLGNGLANLHNARRARTPLVNIVGDHATYHARFDAPLQSDIASLARPVSGWYRVTARAGRRRGRCRRRRRRRLRPPGCVATLVLPADASWSETDRRALPARCPARCPPSVPAETVEDSGAAAAFGRSGRRSSSAGPPCAPGACTPPAASTGPPVRHSSARPFRPGWNAAPAFPRVDRLGYLAEFAQAQLAGRRAPDPGRRQSARLVLRLPGEAERPGAPRLRRAHAGPSR